MALGSFRTHLVMGLKALRYSEGNACRRNGHHNILQERKETVPDRVGC